MTTLVAGYPIGIGAPVSTRRPSAEVIRRRRLGAATLLLGIALLVMLGTLALQADRTGDGPLAAAGAASPLRLASDQVWVVQPGDTVWSIARAADPSGDVRPLVDRITAELHGQPLFPGERVLIPRQ